jgi:mannose-6-phosphate isomerase-like protein (cupin superfamily)
VGSSLRDFAILFQMNIENFFDLAPLLSRRSAVGKRYLEFLRVSSMSAGVYVLPVGGTDPQRPHTEDEMYYVVRGRARMTVRDQQQYIQEGSVIYVEAKAQHRFHDIEEELVVLVFFAPAES